MTQDNDGSTSLGTLWNHRVSTEGKLTICIFLDVDHDVRTVVNGDDFAIVGLGSGVVYIQKGLGARHSGPIF